MAEFTWSGVNEAGKKVSGSLTAKHKQSATTALRLDNIIILSIRRHYHFNISKKFSEKDLLAFSEQLLLLLQSGITLSDALGLLSDVTDIKKFQTLLVKLQRDLNDGLSFSHALLKWPHYFSKTYCNMISAGEKSGALIAVLLPLINNQTQLSELQRKIKKALFYPITILALSLVICMGLLIFVIPQFSQIYSSFGAQLPSMTKTIITLSLVITHHWLLLLVFCLLLLVIFKKIQLTRYLMKLPFFKRALIAHNVVQWSQIMAMTLSARIHLIDALSLANQTLTYTKMQDQLDAVKNAVIAGEKLHTALARCDYLPKRARHFISIGENADALAIMMEKVAFYYTQQFGDLLDNLSKLIEPVIMLIVAGFVSGLMIAMYLPVFLMGSVI